MPAKNVKPYKIIAGAADVYVAATGTPFPSVKSDPGTISAWKRLGHTDGGVKVSHHQTVVELRTDQVTAPVKAVRSEESLEISFSLAEITAENYATVLSQFANRDLLNGGTAGADKVVNLYRGGFGIETFELLVRGQHLSPEGDFNLQYEVPAVYEGGNPEVEYTKDSKALLACNMVAIAANAFDGNVADKDIFGVLRVGAS